VSDGEDKTPAELALEHALELFVYAPIGLLFEGASLLPQLVERGRSQVSMARMVGRFAVRHRRREAFRTVGRLQAQAAEIFGMAAPSGGRPAPPTTPRPATRRGHAPAVARNGAADNPTSIDPASLAIPDYDGLSASQVVNRLAGLSPSELAAVRSYEAAKRGRKTVLSKIAQLQGSG
jgi:hypothetical protein